MFLVEIDVTLESGRRLTDDEITDVIEVLVDEMDHLATEPSVGTARNGDDLDITVGVLVDDGGSIDAMSHGLAIIKAALHAAGMDTAQLGLPPRLRDVRSQVSQLQPTP